MIDVLLSPSDYLRGWDALLTAGTLRTVPSESKLLTVVSLNRFSESEFHDQTRDGNSFVHADSNVPL